MPVNAGFADNQLLYAANLNNAFANSANVKGEAFTGPVSISGVDIGSGHANAYNTANSAQNLALSAFIAANNANVANITSGTITGITNLGIVSGTITYAGATTSQSSLTATLAGNATSTTLGTENLTITDGAKTNGTGPISYFKLTTNAGGANFNGGRNALASIINYSGGTNNKSAGLQGFQTAIYGNINVTGNDNGVATTIGNSQGSFCCVNPSMIIGAAATNLNTVFVSEYDLIATSGSTMSQSSHFNFVLSGGHAVQADNEDNFIMFTGASGTIARKTGIQFGSTFSEFPFDANSYLMKCEISQDPLTRLTVAKSGWDASAVTFGDSFLRSRQFTVDANGSIQIGQGVISANTTGIKIDATGGSVGPIETATISSGNIVNGGTNNGATNWWTDSYGGLYRCATAAAGAVTSLTVFRQPFVKGTPPSNPIAMNPIGVAKARGCTPITANVSWTAGSTLELIGSVTVNGTTVGGGYTSVNFFASLSANQTVTGATFTKLQCNTVAFDTGAYYDGVTNFRFTPLVAGKYKIHAQIELLCSVSSNGAQGIAKKVAIYKNGSIYSQSEFLAANSNNYSDTMVIETIIVMNGSSDYVEIWGSAPGTSGTAFVGGTSPLHSWFDAVWVG